MPESFVLVRLLNGLFMSIESRAFQSLGLSPAVAVEKALSVNRALSAELLVVAGLILFFLVVRFSLSVEKPNPAQQVAEMLHGIVGGQAEQVIGPGYERFQAFVTCIGLFVLFNNLMGLIPGVVTPTSQPWVPLGLAVPVFLYYNFNGLRANGFGGYLKQFLGPLPALSPLIFLIETISHLARILSLTVRLYANMLASDLLTLIAFSMVPLLVPVIPLGLHAFISVIQAFVFMLLTMIYLALAVAHEH
ncbi:MAG: F0F1 ATP synthase subunit A [Terracidiphilus sp.]